MSRREAMPGWGKRIERIQDRLGLSRAKMAERFEVAPSTVRGWQEDDAGTTPLVILRGLSALRVQNAPLVLAWLTTGDESLEPAWLKGEPGSELPPPPTPPAMPLDVRKLVPVAVAINEAGMKISSALKNEGTPQLVREALEEASMYAGVAKRKLLEADQSGVVASSGIVLLKYQPNRSNTRVA